VQNAYDLLDLPLVWELSCDQIERAFTKRHAIFTNILHPDPVTRVHLNAREKKYAQMYLDALPAALQTLKNPLERAQTLRQHLGTTRPFGPIAPDVDLLLHLMTIKETLIYAKRSNTVTTVLTTLHKECDPHIKAFCQALTQKDWTLADTHLVAWEHYAKLIADCTKPCYLPSKLK
jgi:hypothetical protein